MDLDNCSNYTYKMPSLTPVSCSACHSFPLLCAFIAGPFTKKVNFETLGLVYGIPYQVPAGEKRGGRGLVQSEPAPSTEMLQTVPPEAVMVGLTISGSLLGAMICASGASAMGVVDTTYFSSSGMTFLADLDPDTAKLAIGILGPLFAAFNLLFIVRIVMSRYPQLPVGKFPFVIAYAPTEPVLGPTRRLIPPVGGVDVSPVIWLAILSFVSEILLGQQGLLVLLSQQQP
jgi:YggT family protein